jgi:myo-inositol 2-dehydrogenase/D-chiro-inositol 1-dehydrogenase
MRIGIVGTAWGRMHVGAFRAAGAEVVAIAGRDPDRTRRIASDETIPHALTDVGELCDRVDAVVVAGPDALHLEHARIAIERRRPVLCEKPLACSVREADEMLALAGASGIVCAVNFPYRMLPPFAALTEWVRDRGGRTVVATVRNGFGAPGGSSSGDLGGTSHVIDAALRLAGARPRWAQAVLGGRATDDLALHLGLDPVAPGERDGSLVITHVAAPEPGIHGGWSIVGAGWEAGLTAGYVPSREGWCVSTARAYEHGAWRDLAPGVEPRPGEREPWAEAHVETASAFLSAIAGRPPERLASFADGARVQRVIAAAIRSHAEGRRVAIE